MLRKVDGGHRASAEKDQAVRNHLSSSAVIAQLKLQRIAGHAAMHRVPSGRYAGSHTVQMMPAFCQGKTRSVGHNYLDMCEP